jgi:hypothetical protein
VQDEILNNLAKIAPESYQSNFGYAIPRGCETRSAPDC